MITRIDPNFDFTPFTDGLSEVVLDKIAEIIERMEELEKELSTWTEAIENCKLRGNIDEFGTYFWNLWAYIKFNEYDECKKSLLYWLAIYDKLPHKNPVPKFIDRSTKNNLDIERAKFQPIENYYSGELKGTGSRLQGKCPFHEERTPSFFIFTNDNHYHCFSCGKHGDVIDFIRKIKKLNFIEAVKFLS